MSYQCNEMTKKLVEEGPDIGDKFSKARPAVRNFTSSSELPEPAAGRLSLTPIQVLSQGRGWPLSSWLAILRCDPNLGLKHPSLIIAAQAGREQSPAEMVTECELVGNGRIGSAFMRFCGQHSVKVNYLA